MLHRLGDKFPHYLYDDEGSVVITQHFRKRNEAVIEQLKWLTIDNGKTTYRRVTLFEHGNPHYFSEAQIIKMIKMENSNKDQVVLEEKKSIVINVKGEVKFSGSDKEAKKVVKKLEAEAKTTDSVDTSELEQKEEEMKKFFKERENKPLRRDAFVKKFGWDMFESKLLKETTYNGSKYYQLTSDAC